MATPNGRITTKPTPSRAPSRPANAVRRSQRGVCPSVIAGAQGSGIERGSAGVTASDVQAASPSLSAWFESGPAKRIAAPIITPPSLRVASQTEDGVVSILECHPRFNDMLLVGWLSFVKQRCAASAP